MLGDKYIDDEGFIWEVIEQDGELMIDCDELMATETLYPRLSKCKLITDV